MELTTITLDRTRFITREVEVAVGDETLHAVVRPLGISVDTQARLFHFQDAITNDAATAEDIEQAIDTLPRALSEMVVSWDVTIDGKPLEPTYDSLRTLPMDLLQVLVVAIQEAANATPLEETSSPSNP